MQSIRGSNYAYIYRLRRPCHISMTRSTLFLNLTLRIIAIECRQMPKLYFKKKMEKISFLAIFKTMSSFWQFLDIQMAMSIFFGKKKENCCQFF